MQTFAAVTTLAAALLVFPLSAAAQAPTVETLPNGLGRLSATSPDDQVAYTRVFVTGHLTGPGIPLPPPPPSPMPFPPAPIDLNLPTITGQCTRKPDNKLAFEFYVNFGNVTDPLYQAPWHKTKEMIIKPPSGKEKLTLQFIGSIKMKPLKRQFEVERKPTGQYRYLQPGLHSGNLEDIQYDLFTLPILSVTNGKQTAQFDLTAWLAQLRKEPLCASFGEFASATNAWSAQH